ncbi:TetR/AcrR family transcriptional regulator [Grimontia kaedaensis]|uniref:TetR/AcrR family transcriptional regulator n=1 Tax=Grimontia kaedaensis TaxID=2872157 RepID=A0ABY4WX93_9GAMM|nr:TetR/AcrR family transcriptional regulator [Grimontia kaedaensis]USH03618.1 TetR/AcrR family transcriptional regulator [Grimontia kaedaensis]
MAKNTKEGALQTEALIYRTIVDIFMEQGWDAVTYGSIAKRTGLSRSGIQRVVPTKESMVTAFQGQVLAYVTSQIDPTDNDTIKRTWIKALSETKFANCIRYLLGAVNGGDQGKEKVAYGVSKLIERYGQPLVIELIGLSAIYLLDIELDGAR